MMENTNEYWLGVKAYVDYMVKKKYPHLSEKMLDKVAEIEVKQFKKYLINYYEKELDRN